MIVEAFGDSISMVDAATVLLVKRVLKDWLAFSLLGRYCWVCLRTFDRSVFKESTLLK